MIETIILIFVLIALTMFVNHTQSEYGIPYGKMCSGRPLKEDLLESVQSK